MQDFAVITTRDLRDADGCGQRLRRRLQGARGSFMGTARWSVGSRITADARLAHTEMRVPLRSDFPDPTELLAEQVATYRAAALGYLASFGDIAAVAVEIEGRRAFPEFEISLAAGLGVALITNSNTNSTHTALRHERVLTLRKLSVTGRTPTVDPDGQYAIALMLGAEAPYDQVHLINLDLISLESTEEVIDLATAVPDAYAWFEAQLASARERSETAGARTGEECTYCNYIWDCDAHRAARIG